MGCSSCGKVSGCGCGPVNASQVILQPVPAGARPCSPLSNTCGTGQPATPAPYYECSSQCEESHCQEIVYNYYSASICTTYAFNMPTLGETVNAYFLGVKVLPVGAYLWHEDFGYLEVTSFNNQTGQATLLNNGNDGNAAAGTNIPACTCFVIAPPPCCELNPDPSTPYLAENFTAPADGDCTTITVTSVSGLSVGGQITIATGIYVLDEILTPTTIVICNEGDGLPAGTVVQAKNGAGQFQYPIISISVSPCSDSATPSSTGSIVVCSSGSTTTLDGATVGMVPVLTDATTNEVQFDVPPCTASSNVSSGSVLVCSSGDQSILDGASEGQVVVLSNATTNASVYSSSGLVGSTQVTTPEDFSLTPVNTHYSPVLSLAISNPNPHKVMQIFQAISLSFNFAAQGGSVSSTGAYGIEFQINGGGYAVMITQEFDKVAVPDSYGLQACAFNVNPLAASGNVTLDFRGYISNNGAVGDDFDVEGFTLNLSHIAIGI